MNMVGADHSRTATKKHSLFRHFSRGSSDKHISLEHNQESYNAAVRPPIRNYRISRPISDATSPTSPTSSFSSTSSSDIASHSSRSSYDMQTKVSQQRRDSGSSMGMISPVQVTDFGQIPRLTKDKSRRKRSPDTLAERFEMLELVRRRMARNSSDSSKSSGSSASRQSEERALGTSLPTKTFTSNPKITPWTLFLPPDQVHALYMGSVPKSMDDKWFVYSEGPDVMGKLKVHFHRSWSGTKVAELFVVMDVKGEGAGKIVGVKWDERAGGGNNRMTAEEVKMTVRTTAWCVLGVELESEA